MQKKKLVFFYKEGKLEAQENCELFKLSEILEFFIEEYENITRYEELVKIAKQIDEFIWSENDKYITE